MDHLSDCVFYLSTVGNDTWSGKLLEPNEQKTDGPFRTMEGARDALKKQTINGQLSFPIKVWIRGGIYQVLQPVCFDYENSVPTSYCAYPGEEPIFEGGRLIKEFREEVLNGRKLWVAQMPNAEYGIKYFKQLFVNGKRRTRARLPKQGFYTMKHIPEGDKNKSFWSENILKGSNTFKCCEGDIKNFKNIKDVEVVASHLWTSERMPIESFNEKTNVVTSLRKSAFILKDEATNDFCRYYVENIFEALTEPGEWYLDREDGKLYYIPYDDEDVNTVEIYTSETMHFIKLEGIPSENKYVENMTFNGLTFRHADWYQPENSDSIANVNKKMVASAAQAACYLPGSISLVGARHCAIVACKIEHVGMYAIDMNNGCSHNKIVDNVLYDMGAGGIKLNGSDSEGPHYERSGYNKIADNNIEKGSRLFVDGMGIVSMHSYGNDISHNHIHDFYQTGISCGWVWGFGENVSRDNIIEKNHIHDIGQGNSSDMGAVYLLGVQPGTVVRGNVMHDILSYHYGGSGIYIDEGGSNLVIENNICYNTGSQGFSQHYGRENIVRNNIFAFCEGGYAVNRRNSNNSFTFERNIILTKGTPAFVHGYQAPLTCKNFISDLNLFWDVLDEPVFCGTARVQMDTEPELLDYNFVEWQMLGYDKHSLEKNPCMRDVYNFDFMLQKDSPAFDLGFQEIDTSDIGPRSKGV